MCVSACVRVCTSAAIDHQCPSCTAIKWLPRLHCFFLVWFSCFFGFVCLFHWPLSFPVRSALTSIILWMLCGIVLGGTLPVRGSVACNTGSNETNTPECFVNRELMFCSQQVAHACKSMRHAQIRRSAYVQPLVLQLQQRSTARARARAYGKGFGAREWLRCTCL